MGECFRFSLSRKASREVNCLPEKELLYDCLLRLVSLPVCFSVLLSSMRNNVKVTKAVMQILPAYRY